MAEQFDAEAFRNDPMEILIAELTYIAVTYPDQQDNVDQMKAELMSMKNRGVATNDWIAGAMFIVQGMQ